MPQASQRFWLNGTPFILIHLNHPFVERRAAMTPMKSIIQQIHFLTFALACLTWAVSILNQTSVAQADPTKEQVTVILKDFSVHPNTAQAKAGRLTFEAVNEGMSAHELVILRTDLRLTDLPRKEAKAQSGLVPEYLVDEGDDQINIVDEIEEFPSGTSQKKTVSLSPGRYVLFCNIPGHYDKGMHASIQIVQ